MQRNTSGPASCATHHGEEQTGNTGQNLQHNVAIGLQRARNRFYFAFKRRCWTHGCSSQPARLFQSFMKISQKSRMMRKATTRQYQERGGVEMRDLLCGINHCYGVRCWSSEGKQAQEHLSLARWGPSCIITSTLPHWYHICCKPGMYTMIQKNKGKF